jgi:hypothetical protein
MCLAAVMLPAAAAVVFPAACAAPVTVNAALTRRAQQPRAADASQQHQQQRQHNHQQQPPALNQQQQQVEDGEEVEQPPRDAGDECRRQPCRPGVYTGLVRGHVVVLADSSWDAKREAIWQWLSDAYARALAAAPDPATPVLVIAARPAAGAAPPAVVAAAASSVLAWVRAMRRPGAAERRVRMAPPLTYAPAADGGGGGAWGVRLRCDERCAHWSSKTVLPRDLGEKLRMA